MRSITLLFLFFKLSLPLLSQVSYQEIIEKGRGRINIGYRLNSLVSESETKVEKLIEYKILNFFFDYVEQRENVKLFRNFVKADSFSQLYRNIEKNKGYDFGFCFFSKTPKRIKEVNFSPIYLPDIEVMISNGRLPILTDTNDFLLRFNNTTGVYVPGSTFEVNIKSLKEINPNFSMLSVTSSSQAIQKINECDSCFGFIELHQYFNNIKGNVSINRQNLFIKKREGYGFIYPLESDWKPAVVAFFNDSLSQLKINKLIRTQLGSEMIDFIDIVENSEVNNMSEFLMSKEIAVEKDKANAATKKYEDQKQVNKRTKAEREEFKNYLFIVVLAFILIMIIILLAFRQKAKHSKLMMLKNEELGVQKTIVEVKHKEIKDSIHYAKRIQNALLDAEEHTNELLPPHFIYFKPKDVVSGDFYWSKTFEKHYYFSVVDCTGHGVPGGFMSVLGIAMLNEIIRIKKSILPAEILNTLREKVILELDQTAESSTIRDGMNAALIKVNRETLEMCYSGAYHSIVIIRDNQLIELKTDKQPIGYTYIMKPFTHHTFKLEKEDVVYMYSDGYPDQFGGDLGKKFKSRNLKDLLLLIHKKPLEEQKQLLTMRFDAWKGNEEQVDDVTVLGIKI